MSIRLLARTLTALAGVAVATLSFSAAPASAAPAASCDQALVLWQNVGYSGQHLCFGSWESASDLGRYQALPSGNLQDKTSSVQNYTDSAFCLYVDNGYSGDRFTLAAHTSVLDMRVPNEYWNDKISSLRPGSC